MSRDALIAVSEERTRIGNVEISKKTALIATDEGVVAVQVETIEQQPRPYNSGGYPALYGPRAVPAIQYTTPQKGCCDYCCCECDSEYSWYDLEGKGCFMLILLLSFYLVVGIVCLPFLILYILFYCICYPCCRNNNDKDPLYN